MKAAVLPLALAAGAVVFGWNATNVSPLTNPPNRQSGLDAHDESASASLLGQFRTNISAWLWVRTDLYLHNGVQMRPITDAERKSGLQIEGFKGDGERNFVREIDVTLVPSPERDFRGVLGNVDRAVNAWKPMQNHTHNDPVQTLPLFRLMTWLDPQFIEGWTAGAMVLSRDRSASGTRKAIDFVNQGIAENPDSIDLLTEEAYLAYDRDRDPQAAIPLLERARDLGYRHRETLGENERDALENTYKWLALCYRDAGQTEKARTTVGEGLSLFPDDKALPLILNKIVG